MVLQDDLPLLLLSAVAQPLAALPPYGCGVPFTGGERHWQLQIPAHSADRTGSRICHCEGALRPWQSREGTVDLYRLPGKRTRLVGEGTAGPGAAPA